MPVSFIEETQRPNNKHAAGVEIIEGGLMACDQADIVTCSLVDFDKYMERVYPDWQAFLAYVDARTGEYTDQWWQSLGEGVKYG